MKKQYTNPQIYVENVVVESGIALSGVVTYGNVGEAGQGGENFYQDFGDI